MESLYLYLIRFNLRQLEGPQKGSAATEWCEIFYVMFYIAWICSSCVCGAGSSPLDMEATITTPSGVTELCEIRDEPDNLFDVKFTPIEAGTNIISLKQKGIHIAGNACNRLNTKLLALVVVTIFQGRRQGVMGCQNTPSWGLVQFFIFHCTS